MSWVEYISNLTASGDLDKAGIYGLDGSQWAASPGFSPSAEEINAVIAGFNNVSSVQANGVHWAGIKYIYLQSDDSQMQVKYKEEGLSIAKCKTCFLVGHYQGNKPGPARKVIESMKDYLAGSGY